MIYLADLFNPIHGYKIANADILQEMFSSCSKCGGEKCLFVFQQNKSRRGFSEKLCVQCKQTLKRSYTKTTNEKLIDINLLSAHAITSAGGGLTLLRTICSSMDLPPPVHTTPYSKYLKVTLKSATDNSEEIMSNMQQKIL